MREAILVPLVVLVVGCHAAPSSATSSPDAGGCAVGDQSQPDGSCVAPGVPPSQCAAGFVADGQGGCAATMPASDCPAGSMAMPGETSCHAVGAIEPPSCPKGQLAATGEASCHAPADCGVAPWGSAPVDATTQYVDGAFAGTSDGSAARPWKRVGDAITAAAPGAIVAIAAGSYAENVALSTKPVRLWGRCPSMVELVGSGAAAVQISGAASAKSELHQLALRGDAVGVAIAPDTDATLLDAVWVHDTGGYGIYAQSALTLQRSLVEGTTDVGVYVASAKATVHASLVRDTLRGTDPWLSGEGVAALDGSTLAADGLVVERARGAAIWGTTSTVTIESSVLRDMLPWDDETGGYGVEYVDAAGPAATLTVRGTNIARARSAGILAAGQLTALIEDTLVHDTALSLTDGKRGVGLATQPIGANAGASPTVTVRASLFERNRTSAIEALGTDLTIDGCAVRDTAADGSQQYGTGVIALADVSAKLAGKLTLTRSVIERNRMIGLSVQGLDATIDGSVVRGTLEREADGHFGIGIQFTAQGPLPATFTLRGSLVAGNRTIGVLADAASGSIEATTIRDTRPRVADGAAGRGLDVQDTQTHVAPGTVSLHASAIVGNSDCGVIYTQGCTGDLDGVLVEGTKALADGSGGDALIVWDGPLAVTNSRFADSARAGILAYGGQVSLANAAVLCAAFELDGESDPVVSASYGFDLAGGASCGCGATEGPCQVVSANISPPQALTPAR